MLKLAAYEQRVLLTRDTQLHMRAREKFGVPSLLIKDNSVFQQLRQLGEHLALTFPSEPAISRCSICNGIIEAASDEMVQQSREIEALSLKGVSIPEFIQRHQEFYSCLSCGKVFWKGSHWQGILKKTRHLSVRTGQDCAL